MQEINYTQNLWRIDENGNKIHKSAIVYDNVVLGRNNIIGAYCVIGSDGEMRGVNNYKGKIVIGDNNRFSEYVSIQVGSDDDSITFIGSDNLIMRNVHFGHDVKMQNSNEIGCNSIIGGHVTIGSNNQIKLNCTIRNRKSIGDNNILGMSSALHKDIGTNELWYGNPATLQRYTGYIKASDKYTLEDLTGYSMKNITNEDVFRIRIDDFIIELDYNIFKEYINLENNFVKPEILDDLYINENNKQIFIHKNK